MKPRAPGQEWFDGTLVGRDDEIREIRDAFDRIQEPNSPVEAVIVHGVSGCGKTALVEHVIAAFTGKPLLVGRAEFTQSYESSLSFKTVSGAISDVCIALSKIPGLLNQTVARARNELTTSEITLLAGMVPILGAMFDLDSSNGGKTLKQIALNETMHKRFNSIFRRFLVAIASADFPLVLFLENLHQASEATKSLLEEVVDDPTLMNVLLVATVRDGCKQISALPSDALLYHRKMPLSNLTLEAVNELVAKVVQLEPAEDKVQDLAALVYRRCDGNPYFTFQFLDQLIHEELLLPCPESTFLFEWKIDAIESQTRATSNVVEIVVHKIGTMTRSTRAFLLLFAIVGSSVDTGTLAKLMEDRALLKLLLNVVGDKRSINKKVDVETTLKEAVQARLVEETRDHGVYKFTHDRVQQAVLQALKDCKCKTVLLAMIGGRLLELAQSSKQSDWMHFKASHLLIKYPGSFSVVELACLCQESSRRALSRGLFGQAGSFADDGIKLLGSTAGFKTYNTIQVDLHNLAIDAYFAAGKWNKCKKRIKAIREEARRVEDTYNAFNISIKLHIIGQNWEECIDECFRGMSLLGVSFPRRPTPIFMACLLFKVRKMVNRRSPSSVVNSLPVCQDNSIVEVLSLVSDAICAAYWRSEDILLCSLCLFSMKLTIEHGTCIWTPFSLISYASVLTVTGSIFKSYAFGACALELAEKRGHDLPRTINTFNIISHHLQRPMKDQVESWERAANLSLEVGDSLIFGPSTQYARSLSIFCGRSLSQLKRYVCCCPKVDPHQTDLLARDAKRSWEMLTAFKQKSSLELFAPSYQLIQNLMESNGGTGSLSGEFFDDEHVMMLHSDKGPIDTQARCLVLEAHRSRVLLSYTLGHYQHATKDIEDHRNVKEQIGLLFNKLPHFVVCALSYLALAREKGMRRIPRKVHRYIKEIKKYNILGAPDIPAFFAFIEAEMLSLKRAADIDCVVQKYRDAAQLLQTGGFYLLEAKALERLGVFLRAIPGRAVQARAVLQQSAVKYEEFGAFCRLKEIRRLQAAVPGGKGPMEMAP